MTTEELEKCKQANKILRVQLKEQKADYVRTLNFMADQVQKLLEELRQAKACCGQSLP